MIVLPSIQHGLYSAAPSSTPPAAPSSAAASSSPSQLLPHKLFPQRPLQLVHIIDLLFQAAKIQSRVKALEAQKQQLLTAAAAKPPAPESPPSGTAATHQPSKSQPTARTQSKHYSGGNPRCDQDEHCDSWPQTPHCVRGWCSGEPQIESRSTQESASCDACQDMAALKSTMGTQIEQLEAMVSELDKQVSVLSSQVWVGCWVLVALLCAALGWMVTPKAAVKVASVVKNGVASCDVGSAEGEPQVDDGVESGSDEDRDQLSST